MSARWSMRIAAPRTSTPTGAHVFARHTYYVRPELREDAYKLIRGNAKYQIALAEGRRRWDGTDVAKKWGTTSHKKSRAALLDRWTASGLVLHFVAIETNNLAEPSGRQVLIIGATDQENAKAIAKFAHARGEV